MTTNQTPNAPAFTALTDLASRAIASSVVAANDELFAERENLITAGDPDFDPNLFGHKGKVYDGWETRRRREGDRDWAIVALGAPGIVRGVVVDTMWFRGNYPPFISVEALAVDGYPSNQELIDGEWTTLVAKAPAEGHEKNYYEVDNDRRWTHVRLTIYPDGGVSRFRVHGEVVSDPDFLKGTIDLLGTENGGALAKTSDAFYSSPALIILPGRARNMGEGWENARRRGDGNDFAIFSLAQRGTVRHLEVDAGYYVGNAPGQVKISVADAGAGAGDVDFDSLEWTDILAKRDVRADIRHKFLVDSEVEATHLRLDVYPDGGISRLRAWGDVSAEQLELAKKRFEATRP